MNALSVGFARPGEIQSDVVGVGPEIQVPGDELGALVDPDRLRVADPGANSKSRTTGDIVVTRKLCDAVENWLSR